MNRGKERGKSQRQRAKLSEFSGLLEKETQIANPKHGKSEKKRTGARMARRIAAGKANLLKFRRTDGTQRLTHGVKALIASGGAVIPPVPGGEAICAEVDALISEAIADLGGESELTAQRKVVLESERLALLVLKLAGAYLVREGLMNRKTGRPHAVLNIAATYANSARLSALALGLERRAKKVGPSSLTEYLEQKARESEAKPETAAETEAVEVPEPEQ